MTEPGLAGWERRFLTALLAVILGVVALDLAGDRDKGVSAAHLALEGAAGCAAALGLGLLAKDLIRARRDLAKANADLGRWKAESQKHIEGLGYAIDLQLKRWSLSPAEQEVAWLLIKGLSLKEIAAARKTAEKTARAQAVVIYEKSGTHNRSELAAFFLEDLFPGKA